MAKQTARWVQCWGQAHAALSLMYFPEGERTFRLVVSTPISGKALRVHLSNKFGKDPVKIGGITAAPCNKSGTINADAEILQLTLNGNGEFTIYPGQRLVTDSVPFDAGVDDFICISMHVLSGRLTSGNGLSNCLLMFCDGDKTHKHVFPRADRTRNTVIKKVTGILGLHHPLPIPLFEDVELDNRDGASTIVCFGDSLTHQGYWTNPFERIIRSTYPGRYSVINKSVTGNRLMDDSKFFLLQGFFGIKASDRVEEDVFSYDNITHALICIGINDMIQPGTISAPPWDKKDLHQYAEALTEFYLRFREKGIKTIGMNFPPFGGSPDSTPEKHEIRRSVNEWFAANTDICDEFVDIYALTRSPQCDDLAPRYILGEDNLHPNIFGGELLASKIPLDFFA